MGWRARCITGQYYPLKTTFPNLFQLVQDWNADISKLKGPCPAPSSVEIYIGDMYKWLDDVNYGDNVVIPERV